LRVAERPEKIFAAGQFSALLGGAAARSAEHSRRFASVRRPFGRVAPLPGLLRAAVIVTQARCRPQGRG